MSNLEIDHVELILRFFFFFVDSQDPLQCEPDYLDYCESKLEEFDYEYTEYNDQKNKIKQERRQKVSNKLALIDPKIAAFTETKTQGHFLKHLLPYPLDTVSFD